MNISDKLLESIDSASLTVNTDSLDISFGEISSMYDGGELEIRPAYQRLFRWTVTQQSQFIESLLLGLPIPPIFVTETQSRKYELIDGLQRISTYLHFMGALQNHPKYKDNHKLKLRDCEIVKDLNGVTIDDLSPSLKIKVKRSYVKMYIIKKESPARIKYDMFKRLNTGGSLLEAQEIRNSTIRFLSEDFIDFTQKLSKESHFKNTISYIQDYKIERQFDDELVLRFFTLKNGNLKKYKQEDSDYTLADYMTKFSEEVADKSIVFDYDKEEKVFVKTFETLNAILGKDIFATSSKQFFAYYFESLSIAVVSILDTVTNDKIPVLKQRVIELKKDPKFIEYTQNDKHKAVSGKDYLKFLFLRIELAKKYLNKL